MAADPPGGTTGTDPPAVRVDLVVTAGGSSSNVLSVCLYVCADHPKDLACGITVHVELHSRHVCVIVGNENSKPVGGCPALHLSDHLSDNLVVEPSPCTACSVFMHLVGIDCCTLVFLTSLRSSAETYVGSHFWQQRWSACMIVLPPLSHHPLPTTPFFCILRC